MRPFFFALVALDADFYCIYIFLAGGICLAFWSSILLTLPRPHVSFIIFNLVREAPQAHTRLLGLIYHLNIITEHSSQDQAVGLYISLFGLTNVASFKTSSIPVAMLMPPTI